MNIKPSVPVTLVKRLRITVSTVNKSLFCQPIKYITSPRTAATVLQMKNSLNLSNFWETTGISRATTIDGTVLSMPRIMLKFALPKR